MRKTGSFQDICEVIEEVRLIYLVIFPNQEMRPVGKVVSMQELDREGFGVDPDTSPVKEPMHIW